MPGPSIEVTGISARDREKGGGKLQERDRKRGGGGS